MTSRLLRITQSAALLIALLAVSPCSSQAAPKQAAAAASAQPPQKKAAPKSKANPEPVGPTPEEELQSAVSAASNDRAALVRNLEAYLKKYPESPQRAEIYRALVQASLQLRDTAKAADYAERIVALKPDDISITVLAVQLLEHQGAPAGLRRAVNYSSRVLELVQRTPDDQKPARMSPADWEAEKKRDQMSVLLLRGRLYQELKDADSARKDYAASYALAPNSGAATKLGDLDELNKDLDGAIREYARAFALSDQDTGLAGRRELRQKIGNDWRLKHGSDAGLGEYLLKSYDETVAAAAPARTRRNASAKEPYDFTLRKASDGSPYPLAAQRGKTLAVTFWTTWCGPCRELESRFDHVASRFAANPDVVFLDANCDEDESRVPAYLEEAKPRSTIVFADGFDDSLSVTAYPTVVVLDRTGKIVYRAEGYDPNTFENDLIAALDRALRQPGGAPPVAAAKP
jgi:thiol-disulfide isomerase/thioredoxin